MIDWPDCRNARDLGSVPEIRPGALVRSDSLTSLTPAGVAAVRAARVSRIVDLRTAGELAARPSPFADDVAYRHRSLYPDPIPPAPPDLTAVQEYAWLLDLSPDLVAYAVAATAPPGTVVVHCRGGADRTGLVVALTLTAVGIDRRSVVEDYVRSDGVLATTLTGALDHVEERYGGVQNYLGIGGLASGELSALRDRLVLDALAG